MIATKITTATVRRNDGRAGCGRMRATRMTTTTMMRAVRMKNGDDTAAGFATGITTNATTTTTRGVDVRPMATYNDRSRRGSAVVSSAMSGRYGGGGWSFNIVPVPDRVVALLPYVLPLMSALRYGRFFFAMFPAAVVLLKPLMPILRGVAMLPMGNLIIFFAIYLGIAKNQSLSRFCRFNAMQAILLDIALIFPSLVEALFGPGILGIGLPGVVTMVMHNAIFITTLAVFALSAVGCMTGRYVRLPIISEAAEAQMGY